ncbi:MAG: HypC/HybG/HupF family hydrogenase formation chaperone [Planctomycetota bacterium]|nr:MAG: HypC/HybG/HupF family hydrogenase formation chaperone [Planctomycetota bacterium]
MCLAVPGRILSLHGEDPLQRTAQVDFGGVVKEINMAFLPECGVQDYVLVHVGFAISKVDEEEAKRIFEALDSLEEPVRDDSDPTGGEVA